MARLRLRQLLTDLFLSDDPKASGLRKLRVIRLLQFLFLGFSLWEVWIHRAQFPLVVRIFGYTILGAAMLAVVCGALLPRPEPPLLRSRYQPFRRLTFCSGGLHYRDRTGKEWEAPWNDIITVRVSREFGFSSPFWHDTVWLITHQSGQATRLWDEYDDHDRLMRAFYRYLPGFSSSDAQQACKSDEVGKVTCFTKSRACQ